MQSNSEAPIDPQLKGDALVVITEAVGFIAGELARYPGPSTASPCRNGASAGRAWSASPWDLSEKENAVQAVDGAAEAYKPAAEMGGMGFTERFRVERLRSILVNRRLIDAAWRRRRRLLGWRAHPKRV